MLMTSGVKYGLRPTLPHMAGVILGFGLMIAVVGLGLDIVFQRFPRILPIMRIAGSIYMIWLALKIALAKPIGEVEAGGNPIGFLAAAGFQWVNPKAWVMALSALAAYAGVVDGYTSSVFFIAALCALIAIPCSGVWLLFGASLSRLLKDPRVTRPFELDDGRVAGRLDRADPVRIGGLDEPAVPAELHHHHFRRAEDANWRERRSQSARDDHPAFAQRVFAVDVFT